MVAWRGTCEKKIVPFSIFRDFFSISSCRSLCCLCLDLLFFETDSNHVWQDLQCCLYMRSVVKNDATQMKNQARKIAKKKSLHSVPLLMVIFPLRYFDSKPIPVMFQSTWNTVRIQDLWSKMSLHRSRADDQERIEKKSKTHHPLEAACLCFLHSVSTFRTWFQSRSSRPRTLLEYEIQCQKRCYINHNSTSESARVQSHLRKKNVPDFRFSGTVFVFRKVIFF